LARGGSRRSQEIPGAAGCTLESVTYAAHYAKFTEAGGGVLGVSTQHPDQLAALAGTVRFSQMPITDPAASVSEMLTALRQQTGDQATSVT
jgi:peroxiredoxin